MMRMCNDVVTLVNSRFDSDLDQTAYTVTVLRGVSVYGTSAVSTNSKGISQSNSCIIRIPIDVDSDGKVYVDPFQFAEYEDPSGAFYTLNEGDFIIPGIHYFDSDMSLSDIHRIAGAITIKGVTDNRRAYNAPHFKVVGG